MNPDIATPPGGAPTIVALASGAPPAGVAVIRLSGPRAFPALARVIDGERPAPRYASLRRLHHPETSKHLDTAVVLTFPAPASFTGDDTVEFHVHGGPAVVDGVLAALTSLPGVRHAEPGEFTRRAFDNERLDLTQVEAIADLIEAETEAQRDLALSNADGALRRQIGAWCETLLDLLAETEAELDFAESEDDVQANLRRTEPRIAALCEEMRQALDGYESAREIRDGLRIAIIGPPNTGKSSLFNALLRRNAAIVSPTPGTTRDTLEARIKLGTTFATLIDTAGIRKTNDAIEAEGVARTYDAAAGADLVLSFGDDDTSPRRWKVRSRIDLTGEQPGRCNDIFNVSATTGQGLNDLHHLLSEFARIHAPRSRPLLHHQRDVHWVSTALMLIGRADSDTTLRAEDLRRALGALQSVVGILNPEGVLDRIFSRFCVGK